jgi:hypothetical protein
MKARSHPPPLPQTTSDAGPPPLGPSASYDTDDKKVRRKSNRALVLVLATATFVLGEAVYRPKATAEAASGAAVTLSALASTAAKLSSTKVAVPECKESPWKENEDLIGNCPSGLTAYLGAKDASECASSCCQNENCISWQYRKDTGCQQGGDMRIGGEKDGVKGWCSDTVPYRWQGQFLAREGNFTREQSCSTDTWKPHSHEGQCFGLGGQKQSGRTAEDCMKACCADSTCGAWQWHQKDGCFYRGRMHGCRVTVDNPHIFEPFVGRRKLQKSRTYTTGTGKVWIQKLD